MNEHSFYESLQEMQADMVGGFEIAANLGVPRTRLNRWIERRSSTMCPAPLITLKAGSFYSLNEWKGWYEVWRVTRGHETWWTSS